MAVVATSSNEWLLLGSFSLSIALGVLLAFRPEYIPNAFKVSGLVLAPGVITYFLSLSGTHHMAEAAVFLLFSAMAIFTYRNDAIMRLLVLFAVLPIDFLALSSTSTAAGVSIVGYYILLAAVFGTACDWIIRINSLSSRRDNIIKYLLGRQNFVNAVMVALLVAMVVVISSSHYQVSMRASTNMTYVKAHVFQNVSLQFYSYYAYSICTPGIGGNVIVSMSSSGPSNFYAVNGAGNYLNATTPQQYYGTAYQYYKQRFQFYSSQVRNNSLRANFTLGANPCAYVLALTPTENNLTINGSMDYYREVTATVETFTPVGTLEHLWNAYTNIFVGYGFNAT